ncbi:flagellar basal body L-ring protein FlgH [Undibacterium sp. Di26W]|uniref:flagellar basal body L-ring protein FlgH n=1 Tax=Undibacterium sp. Di26W TaxID=3413035 RepID=UPI003BF394EC
MKPFYFAFMLLLSALPSLAWSDNLYNENNYRSLASDKRAQLPGDVLTVLIYESSSASSNADTNLKRKSEIGAQVGLNQKNNQARISVNNDFDGGGTVQRSGKLLAQMSVTVMGIEDNGDLLVKGQQLLEINSDQQKITVEGRVRPLDIADNNTVLSTRLADAKISYAGDGELANHQRPGFWSKLFTWVGF